MTSPSPARWQQLGDLLIQRRVGIDARYRYRNAFADDTQLDWRLLYDIEKARRTNFTRSTIAAIEVAYQLQPGVIQKFLDGGTDTLVPPPEGAREPEPARRFATAGLQRMWDENVGDVPEEDLLLMMRLGEALLIARQQRENRSA